MKIMNNIEAFERMEKNLLLKHHGKVVIFYKGKLVTIDKDFDRALNKAMKKTRGKEFFVHHLYTVEEQSAGILIVVR